MPKIILAHPIKCILGCTIYSIWDIICTSVEVTFVKIFIMKENFKVAQLLLRCALGITFLTPVVDRLGLLGPLGTGNVEWGNWENFINYTSTLMPYFDRSIVNTMGGIATVGEFLIAIFLIVGFKTRYAAIGSSIITLTFILFMATSVGIQKPINFGVFTATTASFLLSLMPAYKWSIDNLLQRKAS